MADPVQTILSAVRPTQRAPVDWIEVANAVGEISRQGVTPPPGAEAALVELINPANTIRVQARELPHIQSPDDMLRTVAIEALFEMTGQKYAALCVQVSDGLVSPIVKRVVAAHFPDAVAAAAKARG
jgi:hypothetical protein